MLTFGVALFVWVSLISLAKHKWIAIVAFLAYCSFSWIAKDLSIQQPMFVIVSSLFSANLINQFRYKPELIKVESKYTETKCGWDEMTSGAISGLLSAFLWGLPTNVVCRVFEKENESAALKIARGAVADAVASIGGLSVLMAVGRARSVASSNLVVFKANFHYTEVAFILFIIVILNSIIASNWEPIMKIYAAIHNRTPHLVTRITVILTVAILIVISNGLFPVTSLICLMINKLTRIAEAPRELSLSSLLFIPIIGIGTF
jgi:hypothetical protein